MSDVSVRKRGEKWEYRIELASINGKRQQKSKSGFKTKSEALKAGRDALTEYENGNQIINQSEISYSDLLDKWINEYSVTDLKQTTTDGYIKKIRLYIKPKLGGYKLKSINRELLQSTINELSNTGMSKNTLSSIRGIITGSFDWAELNGYIKYNPSYKIKIPKNSPVRREEKHIYIDNNMISNIFNRFPEGSSSYIPMMIAYHCGLRLGEVYGLVWDDICLVEKVLYVRRQIQWMQDKGRTELDKRSQNGRSSGNGYWYFTEPKFGSVRCIELDETICNILNKEYNLQIKARNYYENRYHEYYSQYDINVGYENKIVNTITGNNVNFICRRENGEYINPRTMQHTSRIIHNSLGYKDFDFHSFRHTHATMLRENGCPDIYIQHRLGHVKLETTMNIYANHLTDVDKMNGISVLNKIMCGQHVGK